MGWANRMFYYVRRDGPRENDLNAKYDAAQRQTIFKSYSVSAKAALSISTVLIPLILVGCISTQEMPLAPNIVRIDTQAGGLLFTGQTVPQTMRAAAKATLDRGYTHFRFSDASMNQGSVVAGVVGSSSTNFNGNYGHGYVNGNSNTFGSSSVVRAPTASAAATVIMFHANEAGAQGAFDASQVLAQYSQ